MKNFTQFREDLASGRPAKKPVSSNLLKQRAKDNENAMKSGFMKLSPAERAKESKRLGEDKDMCSCDCDCGKAICESCGKPKKLDEVSQELVKKVAHKRNVNVSMAGSKADYDRRDPDYQNAAKKQDRNQKLRFARGAKAISKMRNESARDNYDPEISDKRTKEKLKKAGLPPESPKVMEAKKPIVHSTKPDSLKTIKIKYNKPIRTKVTDIGPGGKEYVRKDWSEETFKPHDMWSPKGEKKFAKTEKEHLALKDKGWGHNNPNKSEEKKKGLDGKACWDGYKQMGTKEKGGKTVDNCVKMKEEQIQIVTNLDFNESLGMLVTRGINKVRDSIKTAEKNTGYKVDPRKNNTPNPVSGNNIAKRLASQKKRK